MDLEKLKEKLDQLEATLAQLERKLDALIQTDIDAQEYLAGETEVDDELFIDAVFVVVQHERASSSMLQRHLAIGYKKALRIMDMLEYEGVIGPQIDSELREVLITNAPEFLNDFIDRRYKN